MMRPIASAGEALVVLQLPPRKKTKRKNTQRFHAIDTAMKICVPQGIAMLNAKTAYILFIPYQKRIYIFCFIEK